MTKSDLIEKLSTQAKLPKKQAEMIVHLIFDSMIEAMRAGDRIEIRGFGSFKVKEYKPYTGRNPKTGEQVFVKQKNFPSSKWVSLLKSVLTKTITILLHSNVVFLFYKRNDGVSQPVRKRAIKFKLIP